MIKYNFKIYINYKCIFEKKTFKNIYFKIKALFEKFDQGLKEFSYEKLFYA